MINDDFRKVLNDLRKIDDENPYTYLSPSVIMAEPKYNIGDIVVHRLEKTENAIGTKINMSPNELEISFIIIIVLKNSKNIILSS